MNTAGFLDRIIGGGNYVVVCWKNEKGLFHRGYRRQQSGAAAGLAQWCAGQKMDAYFAMASFMLAQATGTDALGVDKFIVRRTHDNAQGLKCFWADLDISRPNDGKDPSQVYADVPAAVAWLKAFRDATGMPLPNVWVQSGWGLHVYWVMQDTMTAADWLPYAEALKAAMLATGAVGDVSVSTDHARILRPPGTFNFKDPAHPQEVKLVRNNPQDFPNQDILDKLTPYMGTKKPFQGKKNGASGPTPFGKSKLSTAGQANLEEHKFPPVAFNDIVDNCEQLRHTRDTHGKNDSRNLWQFGTVNTCVFLEDGDAWVHPLSDGYHKYTPEETDAVYNTTKEEHENKNFGPPSCSTWNTHRPGICTRCPLWGKITTPMQAHSSGDLPPNYRRKEGTIQRAVGAQWNTILKGDVKQPVLYQTIRGYEIRFLYEFNSTHQPRVLQSDLKYEPNSAAAYWTGMGVQADPAQGKEMSVLVNSWIAQLRKANLVSTEKVKPFGWIEDSQGKLTAFAVGGRIYRPSDKNDFVAHHDPRFIEMYTPRGKLADWKRAAEIATKGRIDQQAIIACAFGAPLVRFTGYGGLTLSFWSTSSGIGKSTAMHVGQTVWGSIDGVCYRNDSELSISAKIAATQALAQYLDEMQFDESNSKKTVGALYDMAQGAGRQRLNADATLKPAERWSSLGVILSNAPLLDHVAAHKNFTDAGAARLFEMEIRRLPGAHMPHLQNMIVETCNLSYGTAGEVFAEYLMAHLDAVRALQMKFAVGIAAEMGAQAAERFYVAGISCILAGASMAKQCGLINFDIAGLWAFFKAAWLESRAKYSTLAPISKKVNGASINLEAVFDAYMGATQTQRLVTSRFRKSGVFDKGFQVFQPLRGGDQRLMAHIAREEEVCSIHYQEFLGWCRKNNLGGTEVVDHMKKSLNATVGRRHFGGGTIYHVGYISVLDVPLKGPLASYLDDGIDEAVDDDTLKVVSSRPSGKPAAPGNKPKV